MKKLTMAMVMECIVMMASCGTAQASSGYDQVLNEIKYEEGKDCSYARYDMNDDGTEELIVLCGTCEADYQYRFYTTLSDGFSFGIGCIDGGHSSLYESETGDGIYIVMAQMGWEKITEVTISASCLAISADVLYEAEDITTDYYQNDCPIELTAW